MRNAIGSDIRRGIDMAKVVTRSIPEDECSLQPYKTMTSGTRGAALLEPLFSCCVVTLKEEDQVWVVVVPVVFEEVEMASQHCDQLGGICELMITRVGLFHEVMKCSVLSCTVGGHPRYQQNFVSQQYPPAEVRLELLWAMPQGIRGIR